MKIILLCWGMLSLLLLTACNSVSYNKIEIPDDKISSVEQAMKTVAEVISNSKLDTCAIKMYRIKSTIENELLYIPNVTNLIRDSIIRSTNENFDLSIWFPLKKCVYRTKKGEFYLNDRVLEAKTIDEFKQQIYECKELEDISKKEKEIFIDKLNVLIQYNIWGYIEEGNGQKYFEYSKDNTYYSEATSRFLYLEKDIKNNGEINANYKLLDQKGALYLCKFR